MRSSYYKRIKRFISKRFAAKPAGPGQLQREGRELRRLETLIDTVFAVVIVVIVIDLPAPDESVAFDLASFIAFRVNSLILAMLGIIVVLVYWFQSNLLLGNLDRSYAAQGGRRQFHRPGTGAPYQGRQGPMSKEMKFTSSWRFRTGVTLIAIGWICPLFIPFVTKSTLSTEWKTALSGRYF